mmetsp:Transcript_11876/g.32562  ORF Transcript_11876/g.32562 Transcript_11876/m.32562 type:complete len:81 (-) Transcript_11876:2089-2331(-)
MSFGMSWWVGSEVVTADASEMDSSQQQHLFCQGLPAQSCHLLSSDATFVTSQPAMRSTSPQQRLACSVVIPVCNGRQQGA